MLIQKGEQGPGPLICSEDSKPVVNVSMHFFQFFRMIQFRPETFYEAVDHEVSGPCLHSFISNHAFLITSVPKGMPSFSRRSPWTV
jgi:hypothetical protein